MVAMVLCVGVACSVHDGSPHPAVVGSAQAAPEPVAQVLETVVLSGLCEPSGAAMAPDGAVWMGDDDQDDVLFRWRADGRPPVRMPLPALDGRSLLGDIEGLSWRGETLWLLGSHSRNRKGKLKRRARLVGWTPGAAADGLEVHSLWPDARTEGPEPVMMAVQALCPSCRPAPSWGRTNMEGMAWTGDGTQLLVGLRAPIDADGSALVLVVEPRRGTTDRVPDIVAVHRLDLAGRGVRALSPGPHGQGMWLVAGPTQDAETVGEGFALYAWMPGSVPRLLVTLPALPGAPEALVATADREALLFIDEGNRLKARAESRPGQPHRWEAGGEVEFRCGVHADPNDQTAWARAFRVAWAKPVSSGADFR